MCVAIIEIKNVAKAGNDDSGGYEKLKFLSCALRLVPAESCRL
jgi:hypothetical protein